MNAVLYHLKHVLDLLSGSCCRQQCAQSFHSDINVSCQIRMFGPFKEKLHFKECVDRPELY